MLDSINVLQNYLKRSGQLMDRIQSDANLQQTVLEIVTLVCQCFRSNKKLLFAGNGGSAADAQHMSAEYVSRFMFDRPGLASVALTTDTSALTAIGNDYGFVQLFSRQIEAIGQPDDVFFAYSTSGTSPNIIQALKSAKQKGVISIGMTGIKPQSDMMLEYCDQLIRIPSQETPHIQEGHLVIGHLICYLVERQIFANEDQPVVAHADS